MDIRTGTRIRRKRAFDLFLLQVMQMSKGTGCHCSSISRAFRVAGGKEERGFSCRINIPYPFSLSFLNSFAKKKKKERLLRSRRHEIEPDSQEAAIDENMRKKNPLVNACLEFNHVRGGSEAHERRSRLHTNCIW